MDEERYARKAAEWEAKAARWESKWESKGRRRSRSCGMGSGGGGVVVGGIVIVVGLVLLLDNMGIIRSHDIWQYWPLALIAVGLSKIVESHRPAALVWGGMLAGAGALFFLDNLGIVVFDFRMLWPLIVIAFGVSMFLRAMERGRPTEAASGPLPGSTGGTPPQPNSYPGGEEHSGWGGAAAGNWSGPVNSDPTVTMFAIFGGSKRQIRSADFRGGEAFAFCGGFQVDLRGAQMPSGRAVLDVNTIFGGCELIIPDGWHLTVNATGIFGGIEDKTVTPTPREGVKIPELVLTGTAIFGGIGVRN